MDSSQDQTLSPESSQRNLEQTLRLCQSIIADYYSLLGQEAKAVGHICDQMIQVGNFSPYDARALKLSSSLYNIGLISVSRDLIQRSRYKPHTLDENGERLIQSHSAKGEEMISTIDSLRDAAPIIRSHHESWDGTGYPDHLIKTDIPLPARYLAIATQYVESGLPEEDAINLILEQSGKTFDPEAVRLFMIATKAFQLPRNVREVLFSELTTGMILAKSIYNSDGLLLLPEDNVITEKALEKIHEHNSIEPIPHRLLVYI